MLKPITLLISERWPMPLSFVGRNRCLLLMAVGVSSNGKEEIMRYCYRCKKQTEHHMDHGNLKCSLCLWKRIN